MTRTVVALGGNALLPPGAETADEQRRRVRETASHLQTLRDRGRTLVCTHGNGPQVGDRLLEQEHTDTPDFSLDVLGAETQAQIGYQLQQALDAAGGERDHTAVTVLTRTRVDPDDPRLAEPTKPVGPHYTAEEAAEKPFETTEVQTEEGVAHRRVVPSPRPVAVLEADEITALVDGGATVVCGGGGGVPVVGEGDDLRGVEAVVDKDFTARLLAERVDAATLLFLTDVEYAYRNFGAADEEPIESATPADLRALLEADEFGEGSMRPKMVACADFVEETGGRALVTTPANVETALDGETGTHVRPE